MLKVTILVGNPKPQSRTRMIAERLVSACFRPDSYELSVIDLSDHTDTIFTWPSDLMTELTNRVAGSDLVVVASPTYKASYTGLLKAFLDRYPANGLHGVIAIPLLTGADLSHFMAPRTSLVPVLLELGAATPFGSFYFVTSKMDQVDSFVAEASERIGGAIDSISKLKSFRRT
jgi:FMN reductase